MHWYKIFLLVIFVLFGVLLVPFSAVSQDKVVVKSFYSSHCKVCFQLKHRFFSRLKEKYKDDIVWEELETSANEDNLLFLISLAGRYKKEAVTPAVFVGNVFLTGRKDIKGKLDKAIEQTLKKKRKTIALPLIKGDILNVFNKLSVATVVGSGLIDGINPCAFAVIVFFVSFLAIYGYRKREIIWVGTFYCLAVFLTYFLIGLGFFRFLYSLTGLYAVINCFYYFIAIFCFCLAGFSIYDYVRFRITRQADEMVLQLPKFLKKQINVVIGTHLREKENRTLHLSINAFVVGVLVSLLEAVCTGQVYLPTIVFILKNTQLKLKAATYLFIYNLMFVLPLIGVFGLTLVGFSSQRFNFFLKRNIGRIKIFMAILFLVLGVLTLLLK